MIDRGDIVSNTATTFASPPRWLWPSGGQADEHLQNEAGGTVERLMYEQSHCDYLLLWLSASSSACHGLLIITVITPLPTKPSATKMPENWKLANANIDMQMRQAWCCCARCKIHEGVIDAKAEMMPGVMMLPLVVVGCTSKKSGRQQYTTTSGVIMQPPDWQTPLVWDYFTLRGEADHYANNWKEPRSILIR